MTDQLPGKPFDLEAAKRGEPMILCDGKESYPIEAHRFETSLRCHKWVAVYGIGALAQMSSFDDEGEVYLPHGAVIRMAPKKLTVWVVLERECGTDYIEARTFLDQTIARSHKARGHDVLDIFPHEITE